MTGIGNPHASAAWLPPVRRALALTFAGAALALALYGAYLGYVCGVRSVSEGCVSAEECLAKSECISRIHPLLPGYAIAAIAASVFAWRREPFVPLLLGVVGGAIGTLAGFGLGAWGIGIALLLVACGIALAPRDPLAWTAALAALAPLPMLFLVMFTASLAAVWIACFLPTVAWLVFVALRRRTVAVAP